MLAFKGIDWGSADPLSIDLDDEEMDVDEDGEPIPGEDGDEGEEVDMKRRDLRMTLHARRQLSPRSFKPKKAWLCQETEPGVNGPKLKAKTGVYLPSLAYPSAGEPVVVSLPWRVFRKACSLWSLAKADRQTTTDMHSTI